MAPPIRPKLSITLPRNFTFHYTDGQAPKTPEPRTEETGELRPPSPPVYRVRRRIRPVVPFSASVTQSINQAQFQDVPVPTIETSEAHLDSNNIEPEPKAEPVEGYLAPIPPQPPFMSPPKTPLGQILTSFEDAQAQNERPDWGRSGAHSPEGSISRPASACSVFSDSSESSHGSAESFPSTGCSCTSPDSDASDPFHHHSGDFKGCRSSPLVDHCERHGMNIQRRVRSTWTDEMDHHLWTTYVVYLQDPTVTPFKMLPGSTPPLGICHRVAREAKRAWKGPKPHLSTISESRTMTEIKGKQVLRDVDEDDTAAKPNESPDTIKGSRSGSNTPTGPKAPKPACKWPHSQSSTRKRLRELCKRKPSLSPYYQRLIQTRSPSPFQSSRSRSRSSRLSSPFGGNNQQPSFSTRDMNMSLTTSVSTTMQPQSALAQLAQENSAVDQRGEEWFGQPMDCSQSNDLQPLQLGLGIDGVAGRPNNMPRLGSPFGNLPNAPGPMDSSPMRPSTPRTQSDSLTIPAIALRSPARLQDPMPFTSVLKRRAQHQLEDELSPGGSDMRRNFVEELFGAPAEISHRRVRSRGFSLGDIGSAGRFTTMITPPSTYDQLNSSEFADVPSFEGTLAPPMAPDPNQRLGSPFGGYPKVTAPSNAFSNVPAYSFEQTPSIGQRLGERDEDDPCSKRLRG
ncbi:MAG: hypothetical protein M1819_002645 [Sarea resinae]|nr:MAG: hypothetical protein M1819_002645 [Sarea resinae]